MVLVLTNMGVLQQESVPDWFRQVAQIMNAHGVPVTTWAPIAWVESEFNPGDTNPYSGALGLFQVMPVHGIGMDPIKQAEWAAPRMRRAIDQTGSYDPITVAINSDWPGNINALPLGKNDPEVQAWINRYNNVVIPGLVDAHSKLSTWITAVFNENPELPPGVLPPANPPSQPPPSDNPPYRPLPPNSPPSNQSGNALGNIITLPDWQLGSIFGQPITINSTQLANVGGRFVLSAIAMSLIAVGILAIAWQATPNSTKAVIKDIATE